MKSFMVSFVAIGEPVMSFEDLKALSEVEFEVRESGREWKRGWGNREEIVGLIELVEIHSHERLGPIGKCRVKLVNLLE